MANVNPTTEPSGRVIEHRDLVLALFLAAVSLVVSATLLAALLALWATPAARDKYAGTTALTIKGSDLAIRIGLGGVQDQGVFRFKALAEGTRALATAHTSLSAEQFPFVHYRLLQRHPGQTAYLIWRRADAGDAVFRARLPLASSPTLRLHGNPQWQGYITEIGFEVYGDLRGQPMDLEYIEFPAATWRVALSSLWSLWSTFPGWNLSSINHLAKSLPAKAVTETTAAAAWAGLAFLLLLWPASRLRQARAVSFTLSLLVPWIALDLLWQQKLDNQLTEASILFAGKSMHEKHLVDIDATLYRYAQRLKRNVLPDRTSRIFILHTSLEHNFDRLKSQYYLLPHNVYNFGKRPAYRSLRPGDYILALGNLPELQFKQGRLHWQTNRSPPLSIQDEAALGTLYRVEVNPTPAAAYGQQGDQ